jgi:transcriptional regulator with XRE-family HTH domain
MDKRKPRRTRRNLTKPEERLQRYRKLIARELPQLIERDQMRKDASDETTLSGELRRTVHASELSLTEIAKRVGIASLLLDDFLTGERTLHSDVLDRLAETLGFELSRL